MAITGTHSVGGALILSEGVTLRGSLVGQAPAGVVVGRIVKRPREHAVAAVITAEVSLSIPVACSVRVAILSVVNRLVRASSETEVADRLVGRLDITGSLALAVLEPVKAGV